MKMKIEKCTLPPREEVVWGNDLASLLSQYGHFLYSKACFQVLKRLIKLKGKSALPV